MNRNLKEKNAITEAVTAQHKKKEHGLLKKFEVLSSVWRLLFYEEPEIQQSMKGRNNEQQKTTTKHDQRAANYCWAWHRNH